LIDVVGDARVLPPVLLTVTFCAAGLDPPTVSLKLRVVGESEIVGDPDAEMTSVTGMLTGELVAPELVILIVPV